MAKHSLNASHGNHWIIYKKICNGNNLYLKSKIELFNPENERVLKGKSNDCLLTANLF